MPDDGQDIYLFDGESIARVLASPLDGRLCEHIKKLAGDGKLFACRRCFQKAIEGAGSPLASEIGKWGFVLIDDDESVDIECARLISNVNPAFMTRANIYYEKLTVVAKSRLNGCTLVTDDTSLASSSMENICDELSYPYETFDDLFGNL